MSNDTDSGCPQQFETTAIRTQWPRAGREHSVPLYLTSSFVFEDAEQARAMFADEVPGNLYSRFSNPNTSEFIEKLCLLEGCEDGLATATGMSAMFTSMAGLLRQGDHVLMSRSVFGSTYQIATQILPRWGIEVTFADLADNATWEAGIQANTKMLFAETPSNPGLALGDLAFLGKLAHDRGLILNIDNCFATPYLQNPAQYGAHLVTHSATKWIDGQGRVLGGAILGSKALIKELRFFARHSGPAMSPFNAWVLSRSLETLAVRMEAHCRSALALAQWLQTQPGVRQVHYPFLPSHPQHQLARQQMRHGGGIVTLEAEGGLEHAKRIMDSLKLISHSANLGDTRTIATMPAITTHSKLSSEERVKAGIPDGLIRLSVGLEHLDDLKAELTQALAAAKG